MTTTEFQRDDFVAEYPGEVVTTSEANQRHHQKYTAADGCFVFWAASRGRSFCFDATVDDGRIGRLINHSHRSPNCKAVIIWVRRSQEEEETPALIFVANRRIQVGEEVTFDYGDRDVANIKAYPWLRV